MKLTTVVITDGRQDYLAQCLRSLGERVPAVAEGERFIIDDAGEMAGQRAERWRTISHLDRQGMAAAVRTAWETALDTDCTHLFHVEEDFTFNTGIPLVAMGKTLYFQPSLAQIVLKRQPWSDEEIAAGGQMEVEPGAYLEAHPWGDVHFMCHRKLFSFNPSLIPRTVVELCMELPGDGLERGFTDTLLDHHYSFAYWGRRYDPPLCTHIGVERSPGYRW